MFDDKLVSCLPAHDRLTDYAETIDVLKEGYQKTEWGNLTLVSDKSPPG